MPEIFTPWSDESELLQVRAELDSNDDGTKRNAIERIEMWIMRGNCPHAVSSTAYLTDAMLNAQSGAWSTLSARSLLASSFARFVTGFCDIGQGSNSRTAMSEVAKLYGMPASFIALRHDIAHRELPSLHRLEKACCEGLQWLRIYYWRGLYNAERVTPQATQEVKRALKRFLQERRQEVHDGIEGAAASRCCQQMLTICRRLVGDDFCQVLAIQLAGRGGILIARRRKEGDSMEGAYKLFDGLLRRLGDLVPGSLQAVMDTLTDRLMALEETDDPAQQEALFKWILHLFTDRRWSQSRLAGQIQRHRRRVVEQCSQASSKVLNKICSRLIEDGDDDFREAMEMHVSA